MKYVFCTILISFAYQTHFIMAFSFQTKRLILIGLALGVLFATRPNKLRRSVLASNFNDAGACTYCDSTNRSA